MVTTAQKLKDPKVQMVNEGKHKSLVKNEDQQHKHVKCKRQTRILRSKKAMKNLNKVQFLLRSLGDLERNARFLQRKVDT